MLTTLTLLAARALSRATAAAAPFLLVHEFGAETFGAYAVANGAALIIVPVAAGGLDKAALKVVPRLHVAAPAVRQALADLGTLLALVVAAVASLAIRAGDGSVFLLIAVLQQAAFGLLGVAQANGRAAGRPAADWASTLALISAQAAALLLACLGHLSLTGFALATCGATATIAAATTIATRPWLVRALPLARRLRVSRAILAQAAPLGLNTLIGNAGLALVFAGLAATAQLEEAAWLQQSVAAATAVFAGMQYAARLAWPVLTRRANEALRDRATETAVQLLPVVAVVLAALFFCGALAPNVKTVTCAVVLAVVFTMNDAVTGLLELGRGRGAWRGARMNALALAATAGLALVLIPAGGGLGATFAIMVGDLVSVGLATRAAGENGTVRA